MPRINLLPMRALARLEQAKRELALAGCLNALLAVLLLGAYQVGAQQVATLASHKALAQGALDKLASDVAETQKIKAHSVSLGVKLAAIEQLRNQKVGPAQMLALLADVLSELPRVWLTRLNQVDAQVTLEGGAMSQGDISAFQLAIADRKPALQHIELALVNTAHHEGADFLQWTITCKIATPNTAGAKATP